MNLPAVYFLLVILALLAGWWARMAPAKLGVVALVLPVAVVVGYGFVFGVLLVFFGLLLGGLAGFLKPDGFVAEVLMTLSVLLPAFLAGGILLVICCGYFRDERAMGARPGRGGSHLPLGVEVHCTRSPIRYHGNGQV